MKKIIFTMLALAVLFGGLYSAYGRNRGLTYHEIQFVDETGTVITDITSINIYNPDTTTNATIYMDSGLANAITQPITTTSTNTTYTSTTGTLYWWGGDGYDYTITDGTNTARNANHRTRTSSEGRLWFPSYLTDVSSASYADTESVVFGDDSDFTLNSGTTANRLTITPVTNGTSSIYMGSTAACCDVEFWGDTAGRDMMWDATDNRLEFEDNAIFAIGTDNDYYIAHDGSTTTITGATTYASASIFSTDVTFTGNAYNVEWDNSSDTLHLLDNAELGIGGVTTADGDVVFKWDGTDLDVLPAAVTAIFKWGNGTNDFDMWWYASAAGDYMLFDEGAAELFMTDIDIQLDDDAVLIFGTGDDFTMYSDTADTLEIDPGAAGDQFKIGTVYTDAVDVTWYSDIDGAIMFWDEEAAMINLGADDHGLDVSFFGDTASHLVWWDCSGDEWFFGADDDGVDVTWYGDTSGSYMKWDTSADSFEIEGQFDIGELATFGESDDTPDVHGHCYFVTHATTDTITDFDGTGIDAGQIIVVESAGAITYDVTSSGLKGGSTDLITADGDLTTWIYNGTDWLLIAFMDLSDDMT